MLFLLLIIFII